MPLLKKIQHIPSGSVYDIHILESNEMKNQAFALLYRKYIEESKDPWEFPKQNPSNLRIEKRVVDGISDVPVLVDDFEHSAFTLGIVDPVSGKVVGTGRMLHREKMPDGKLEIERYNSLPHKFKTVLDKKKCHVEVNRFAIDDDLKGKRSGLLLYVSILSELSNVYSMDTIVYTQPLSLFKKTKAPGYSLLVVLNQIQNLGSFKYNRDDTEPAMVCLASKLAWINLGIIRALKAGTILIPSRVWWMGAGVISESSIQKITHEKPVRI